jgi:hypothetical protein
MGSTRQNALKLLTILPSAIIATWPRGLVNRKGESALVSLAGQWASSPFADGYSPRPHTGAGRHRPADTGQPAQ